MAPSLASSAAPDERRSSPTSALSARDMITRAEVPTRAQYMCLGSLLPIGIDAILHPLSLPNKWRSSEQGTTFPFHRLSFPIWLLN
jgi:hypothetical protein